MAATDKAQQARQSRIKNIYLNKISEATNWSIEEIQERVDAVNQMSETTISAFLYQHFALYSCSEDQLPQKIALIQQRKDLAKQFKTLLRRYNKDEIAFNELEGTIQESAEVCRQLMCPALREEISSFISKRLKPSNYSSEGYEELLIDVENTRALLGFSPREYVAFGFEAKSMELRQAYLSNKEGMRVLVTLNRLSKGNPLSDKYATYEMLRPYFKRDIVSIDTENGLADFEAFMKKHSTAVFKQPSLSMGKSIRKIKCGMFSNKKKLFAELTEGLKDEAFVLEELIVPHSSIKTLNPDSVNTVRVITFFRDDKVTIENAFMKIGRAGAFVDNGGAGGLLVHVNKTNGKLNTDGVDEDGFRYDKHPDNGTTFKGYQLPNWDQVIAMATELGSKVPNMCYIGWDFTCNKRGEWIVVEANSLGQFIGQQATVDHGCRLKFRKKINRVYQAIRAENAANAAREGADDEASEEDSDE